MKETGKANSTLSWSTAPPPLLCHSQPRIPWNSHPRAALPSALPSAAFSHGNSSNYYHSLLAAPLSCPAALHMHRAARTENGSNLPCSGRGAEQAACLLLHTVLGTPQGLSLQFRMSRGCHGIQAHFAQHWKSQLRAAIIPKQIKGGKFVGGRGDLGTKLNRQRRGFLLEQEFVLFDFCLERPRPPQHLPSTAQPHPNPCRRLVNEEYCTFPRNRQCQGIHHIPDPPPDPDTGSLYHPEGLSTLPRTTFWGRPQGFL